MALIAPNYIVIGTCYGKYFKRANINPITTSSGTGYTRVPRWAGGDGFHETQPGIRYTISEPARREVLTRLLQLNHQRYEEEVKLGLHHKKGKKQKAKSTKKKAPKKNDGQLSWLDD